MKKGLTILFVFMFCNIAQSQFSVSAGMGYGIRINNNMDYDLFQSTVTVEPQYNLGKFKISAVALAVNDSTADFFTGIKPSYKIWETSAESFALSISAMQGLEGKQLLGGGITYEYTNMYVSGDAYHEVKNNQFIGNLSVGIYILR